MITYGDYFSRKTLYSCGVSVDKKLFKNDETAYTGTQRIEKIRSDMSEIYQTLHDGYTENTTAENKAAFADFRVERKIVAAFYDSGILSKAEREYFQTQTLENVDEREQISVEEANATSVTTQAKRVEAQAKTPAARDIRS
jgi:hypothetical protein